VPIPFNDAVADDLINATERASRVLRDQTLRRARIVEQAARDFHGQYAKLFIIATRIEQQDRIRLAEALDNLTVTITIAKTRAQEERQRHLDVQTWQERHSQAGMSPFDIEPMPSTLPLAPPEVDASFHARERDRLPRSGWEGRTSARPESLRIFVYESFAANQELRDEQTRLQRAWVNFARECSWIPIQDQTFLVGFTRYLMENRHDEDWVDSIAKAFERVNALTLGNHPGGFTQVTNLQLSLDTVSVLPQQLASILNQKSLGTDKFLFAISYLTTSYPHSSQLVGRLVATHTRALNHNSSGEDIQSVTDLLNTMQCSSSHAAAFLLAMGARGLLQALGMAGVFQANDIHQGPHLARALRGVFQTGEPTLAKLSPEASQKFAKSFIDYLQNPNQNGASSNYSNEVYALSYLLHDNRLSTPFLGALGNELDKFDTMHGPEAWVELSENSVGTQAYQGITTSSDAVPLPSYDPALSYMLALQHNGDAALQFFTGKGSLDPGDYLCPADALQRRDYWLQHRQWPNGDHDAGLLALDAAIFDSEPGNADSEQLAASAMKYYPHQGWISGSHPEW